MLTLLVVLLMCSAIHDRSAWETKMSSFCVRSLADSFSGFVIQTSASEFLMPLCRERVSYIIAGNCKWGCPAPMDLNNEGGSAAGTLNQNVIFWRNAGSAGTIHVQAAYVAVRWRHRGHGLFSVWSHHHSWLRSTLLLLTATFRNKSVPCPWFVN